MKKHSRTKLIGTFSLLLPFLSHCIATPTTISRPTIESTRAAQTIVSATVSTSIHTSNGVTHHLADIGTELLLPSNWQILRIEGGYVARPASVQSEIDPAAFALVLSYRQDDLPQALPALTEILAPRLGENEPHPLTTQPITIDDHTGVAFLGFQNLCMEIFVPVKGVIHQIDVGSYLCKGEPGKRQLTPDGQAVLASIHFFPLATH